MRGILDTTRWALPLAIGGAGLVVAWGSWLGATMATLCGVALGATIHLLLSSVAVLTEDVGVAPARLADAELDELEHDKVLLLRSIKEVEFDAGLQRLPAEEVTRLTAPLKQRAVRLLREIDRARVGERGSVDEQIEREVERRLSLQRG